MVHTQQDKIRIRTATIADWQTIQKLNVCVFADNLQYDTHQDLNWSGSEDGANYYKNQLTNPDTICLIAELESESIGYIVASHKIVEYRTRKTYEVQHMGVAPEHRSQGIGSMLIQELKKKCKELGCDSLYVSVYFKNNSGIRFYEKSGFTPIDMGMEVSI